jgi:SagB-type dehydrogenase family enzyme
LGYTAGIQHWVTVPPADKVALKTSPSGGARHAVEVYTLAWGIKGLPKGLYHYVPDNHELELVRGRLDQRQVPIYLPFGDYWSAACAVVFFSAAYERELWRYPYSRAYRAPLVEAGHLCQTFCLMATSLNLAPFCAMGLADTAIERDLGIDGITESVLYAAGVGIRPNNVQWAPAPDGFEAPSVEPNPYLQNEPESGTRQTPTSRRPSKRS